MSPEQSSGAEPLRDEPFDPDVVGSEMVFKGRVWNVRSDTVTYNDRNLVRQYVEHPGAAAVVALDDHDRVLVLQQYRHPIRHRDWEIPAGLLDPGDRSPEAAARRELAEEADLVAYRWDELISVFTTPGGNNEIVHVFLARELVTSSVPHPRVDEEADMAYEWVHLDALVAGVLAGRVRNGLLAVGVLAAAERLRRNAGL